MTTLAEKLGTKETTVTVIQRGARREIIDPELANQLRSAHSLWQRLGELEAEFARAKGLIAKRAERLAGGGYTVTLEAAGTKCTVTIRHEASVPEHNIPEMRRLLGRRFKDLVKIKTRYTATKQMVDEAGEDALKLIVLRRLSPQFKWSAAPKK